MVSWIATGFLAAVPSTPRDVFNSDAALRSMSGSGDRCAFHRQRLRLVLAAIVSMIVTLDPRTHTALNTFGVGTVLIETC